MERYYQLLINSPLFASLTEEELAHILGCLGAKVKKFSSNQMIIREAEQVEHVGVVLDGGVLIISVDAL